MGCIGPVVVTGTEVVGPGVDGAFEHPAVYTAQNIRIIKRITHLGFIYPRL